MVREENEADGRTVAKVYTYEEDGDKFSYGRLLDWVDSEGKFKKYSFDLKGRIVKEVRNFVGSTVNDPESEHHVSLYSYAPFAPGDDGETYTNKPRMTVVKIQGQGNKSQLHSL